MKSTARTALPILLLILAGCATAPTEGGEHFLFTPSATLDPFNITLGQVQALATKQALDATSQAISASMTQTMQAPTLAAAQTATERAWMENSWTATAAVQQTATAVSRTATAEAWTPTPDFTGTVQAVAAEAQATALYAKAVSVELAVERERTMNRVWAVTPWMALMLAFALTLLIAWRWSQVRPVQRDERGDAPLLVVDGKVYDADRNPYPLADFSGQTPSIPALTPPDLQAAVTAADQAIDLATRGAGQPHPQRQALAGQMMQGSLLPPVVRVLPPDEARPLLADVVPAIARDAIEADLTGQEKENE